MRGELQDVLGDLALPTLLVTHDFRDAAALAGRIGVIVDGRLRQEGTAAQLVAHPADAFVASFTGGNLLPGRGDGGVEVALDAGGVVRAAEPASGRVGVAVYPWEVGVALQAPRGRAQRPAGRRARPGPRRQPRAPAHRRGRRRAPGARSSSASASSRGRPRGRPSRPRPCASSRSIGTAVTRLRERVLALGRCFAATQRVAARRAP